MDVSSLTELAEIAIKASNDMGLRLIVASKHTIAEMEAIFMSRICDVLDKASVAYEVGLSDDVIAQFPHLHDGGFIAVMTNEAGDTGTDVINEWHGGHSMNSIVYCRNGVVYEEMPGGTDPRQFALYKAGQPNYHTPAIYVQAFARMFAHVNPQERKYLERVSQIAVILHDDTPENLRETFEMIKMIKKEVLQLK